MNHRHGSTPHSRSRLASHALIALGLACALAGLTAAQAPAALVTAVQQAGAKVSPKTAGTKSNPRAISLTLLTSFDPAQIKAQIDASNQFAMTRGEILLPKQGTTNARRFPGCAPTRVLANESRCPSGSLVGRGTATGVGLNLVEPVTLKVYNRPNGAGVTVLVVSEPAAPVELRDIVVAKLTKLPSSNAYGWRLDFTIPDTLLSPVQGVLASIQQLRITLPASYLKKQGRYVRSKGKRIPYIATTGCSGGSWNGRFTGTYTTAIPVSPSTVDSTQTVDVKVPCSR